MAKYIDSNGFQHFWSKLKALLASKVDAEFKTDSDSAYKVLSDNNLTDELLEKINNAGDSSFTGSYMDLADLPTEFPPSRHVHSVSDITDFSDTLNAKVNEIVGVAPEALNTLQELSAALGDDENFAANVTAQLANKLDKNSIEVLTSGEIDAICV